MRKAILIIGLSLLAVASLGANPILFATPTGTTEGGHTVSVQATFDIEATFLTVTLKNLLANPISDDQNLSFLTFDIGANLSNVSFTSSGQQIAIQGSQAGGYTTTSAQSIPWSQLASGPGNNQIGLCDIKAGACQGQGAEWPKLSLVGSPNSSNAYANANGSLTSSAHNSMIWQTATFTLTAVGLPHNATPSTTIRNVVFGFGTGGTENVNGVFVAAGPSSPAAAPEPGSAALLFSGVAFVVFARCRRTAGR